MSSALPAPGRENSAIPAWVEHLWNTNWLWMAIVILFFCLPLFIGLGRTDFENDESIYSFAVDVMVKNGDWLTPKSIPSETSAFLEKPPLKFWLVAVPVYFGWLPGNEFGHRFMDALLASFAFLYVFAIGRKMGGPVTGLVAVLLLFTQERFLFQHGIRTNNMESSMLLAYAGGVYHFLAWRSVNPDAKKHIYAMSLWFVFGFMTKFVAVLFLPVILVMAAVLTHPDRVRAYRDWKTFAAGALLAIALIAPWFVYQYFERGPRLFDIMFGAHVMKRFTAFLDPAHLHPWNYYFQEIWADLRTAGSKLWIVLGGLLLLAKTVRHRWVPGAVVVLWFVVPIAAMSATTSKLYHYAYPFLPPVALAGGLLAGLVAKYVFQALRLPFDAYERARDGLTRGWLSTPRLQMAAIAVALVSTAVAFATYAFDRIRFSVGSVLVRSSDLQRPAIAALVALFVAAPASVLRGVTTALILSLALPLNAYHVNLQRTKVRLTPYGDARACLARVANTEIAQGAAPPGVWVEAGPLSFIPFYYLRDLGPWQRRDVPSDQTAVMHLLAPGFYRPLLLSDERYAELRMKLMTNGPEMIGRAAALARLDYSFVADKLDSAILGVTPLYGATLVLPGPYSECGEQRSYLVSR